MFQTILCPLDQSEYSKRVFAHASDMAEKFHAHLILLNVFEPPEDIAESLGEGPSFYVEKLRRAAMQEGEKFLQQKQKQAEKKNIKVTLLVQEGDTAEVIENLARERNCDLIIMGSRGLGAVKSFLLGSVSNHVIHHSTCPVLAIH